MSKKTSVAKPFGLYGNFVGGPVMGCHIVTYSGLYNDQKVVMVDHPCDPGLMAWMTAEELEEQMLRAASVEYFPEGFPEDHKPRGCGEGRCDYCAG